MYAATMRFDDMHNGSEKGVIMAHRRDASTLMSGAMTLVTCHITGY